MPNTPTYILYHGKATGKDKAGKKIWTRIGAVWPNKSGKGFNLTWEYLPLAACRRERARRYVPSCPCSVDGYSSRSQRAVGCRTRIRDTAQRVLSGHRADNHL